MTTEHYEICRRIVNEVTAALSAHGKSVEELGKTLAKVVVETPYDITVVEAAILEYADGLDSADARLLSAVDEAVAAYSDARKGGSQ